MKAACGLAIGHVAGVVLCGGQSRRMGRPKCWLPYGGEIMLPRIVRILSQVVSPIIVVALRGQELPPLPADVILTHDPRPELGPLQGLAAGLAAVRDRSNGAYAAYVSSCDVPLLQSAFVRRMIELVGETQACVPRIDGFYHPLAGVYRCEVGAVAEQLLAADRRSLTDLISAIRTRFVSADELTDVDPDLRSLRNVNTPEEYAAALRDAELSAQKN